MARSKQLLRDAISQFTVARIREVQERTGWDDERLCLELFKLPTADELKAEKERGGQAERRLQPIELETYLAYLLPPNNPKSRLPLAARLQALENRVAALVGRRPERVVIWDFEEVSKIGGELSRHGPPGNFKNAGTPGVTKIRGTSPKKLSLNYAQPAYTYLSDLITQADMWPSLARSWQLSTNEEPFHLEAQRRWLLTWQMRIQGERSRTPADVWQKYWKRLPQAFKAICDARQGSLPVVPEIWPEPLLEQMGRLSKLLGGTGTLPEFCRKSAEI
jgi:hypothetical protein